jgi:fructokinase
MILICGEALVDLFVSRDEYGNLATRAVPGGSPFNVAVGLRRLGEAAAFCGGLSSDAFGQALYAKLETENVDLSYVLRSPCLSTISVIATDAGGHPSYSFHGEGKADRQVAVSDLPQDLPDTIGTITFGSYSLAVPPVGDALLALAKRESGRRIISIDPNVRPTVTPDMLDWRARFEAFLPHANIIKVSEEDLQIAYPGTDFTSLVALWHEAGPSLVTITHGAHGATGFFRRRAPVTVSGRHVQVVDSVGAGDSFHAALLASLSRMGRLHVETLSQLSEIEMRQALEYAVVASSITCTRAGADGPTSAEVSAVLRE